MVQLTINQHWFKWWLGTDQAITWTNADPVHQCIYVALGGDEVNIITTLFIDFPPTNPLFTDWSNLFCCSFHTHISASNKYVKSQTNASIKAELAQSMLWGKCVAQVAVTHLPSDLLYKLRQIQKLKCFYSRFCSCLCPIHGSQVLGRKWRCSWSSANRQCSNYIWVINNFVAY